jgi:uncharacterized protein YdhG (YjbR/CyaY superfamily)
MASGGNREDYFAKVEEKHGFPVEHWFDQLGLLDSDKYPDQIALLKNEHGFSQAPANAVVMFYRGSTSSSRYASPDAYFESLNPPHRALARAIFAALQQCHPDLELVIAWNQPMLRHGNDYVFGLSASTRHLSVNPFSKSVLDSMTDRLTGFDLLKHTFRIPLDWSVDADLLCALVSARIAEVDG